LFIQSGNAYFVNIIENWKIGQCFRCWLFANFATRRVSAIERKKVSLYLKYLRFYNLLNFRVLANVGGVFAEGVELAVISAPCSSAG
jgi:hypothetical protein